ncbi:hypothetical protein C6P96_05015 [Burkholderia multivorans]|nr:hypothetical protein C6P95_25330 [Burkholderia multivorans]PRF16491.1 hypothetical protein C6P96_05015 [Burkholderia multivorans]
MTVIVAVVRFRTPPLLTLAAVVAVVTIVLIVTVVFLRPRRTRGDLCEVAERQPGAPHHAAKHIAHDNFLMVG